jgi:1-phosphatidylinositol-4-phosphate 5-kinase
MDYSLLVGVKRERFEVVGKSENNSTHNVTLNGDNLNNFRVSTVVANDAFKRRADGGMQARIVEGPGMYYFGIIDILQEYNLVKRIERWFKIYIKFEDGMGLSAIGPDIYCERFWRRCIIDTFDGFDESDTTLQVNSSISKGSEAKDSSDLFDANL